MHIAIVGATGMLGQPVTRELIRAGFAVRLIARDVAKTRALFPNIDVVSADLRNVDALRDALVGMDAVYLNLSIRQDEKQSDFHTEAEGLQNLILAAQSTGVKRIGYLSSIIIRYQGMNGFRWWVFDVKQAAVERIKESGLPYSIFYPSCFMDSMNGTQRAGRFILLVGRSGVKPMYIAASDYGRQVARAFQLVKDGQNQEYIIQGPEAVTQHEAAERFVKAYAKEKLRTVTTPSFLMKLGGFFTAQADYGWHITEALNNYPEGFESQKTWDELGKPTTTIEQFAGSI
ncbi:MULTISPECIES: SDR family oxidoreductase [unclassified Spirosoma]|uniref:SDR family oxidoreductase n=1 Tax=unclassified Spirosoma TaxID=2621999 RepID=UPI000969804B|nr:MULTISPECIES: NAD(P)H-binding protein [unclassified Spirosoma]MBN8823718.1 NAD(P)H-binding protein [Spirosoma sp.]OJW76735.1 MAG: NmrA family transcriptional regulator [Spirosoma sp. 48-14]